MKSISFPDEGGVLIFGGTGGVGSAICMQLMQTNVPVAITFHKNTSLAEQLKRQALESAQHLTAFQLDLFDATATAKVVEEAASDLGGIHTVIYSVGPKVDIRSVADVSPDEFGEFINADLRGFFHGAHAVIPHLRSSKGSLVACITFAVKRYVTRDVLSAAPKSAVQTLIQYIASEEGCRGVRANAVGLGWIDAGVGSTTDSSSSLVEQFGQEELEFWLKHTSLGRAGTAEELSNAVLFLASNEASYITGQTLYVDGGVSL